MIALTKTDMRELLRLLELFERRPAMSSKEADQRRRARRMRRRLETKQKNENKDN